MSSKLKLLIIGHGRHGKDTVCDIIKKHYGYSFESSSRFCCNLFIYQKLKYKYNYTDKDHCYTDRHKHRQEWYNAICEYNTPDASKLGKQIFKEHDIYCGLRNKREFYAMRNTGVFDYAIWVDRCDHLKIEPKSSMSLEPWMADYVIDNNATLEELTTNTTNLINYLHKVNSI